MKSKHIRFSETTNQNIGLIQAHTGIMSTSEAIRYAVNFCANTLRKENAKIDMYAKRGVVKVLNKNEKTTITNDSARVYCLDVLEGTITDKEGKKKSDGNYCKFDKFEKVTNNLISHVKDYISPLSNVLEEVKYLHTNKVEVNNFEGEIEITK